MEIRLAEISELSEVMAVYRAAQDFMIKSGNPTQWGHFYPPKELIEQDISNRKAYVITENNIIRAVFTLHFGEDPTYKIIENGSWLNNEPYAAIHRVASDGVLHGVFRAAADFCAEKINHIRVDTHEDNLIMQRQIEKYGFKKCGIIFTASGSPRIAYEWDRK
ncbi:MAG: N-acetyltransferase [Oscillospiraceae bacterium]|nr:N-acetyltransferase [Oscillospiraceae bacterium]